MYVYVFSNRVKYYEQWVSIRFSICRTVNATRRRILCTTKIWRNCSFSLLLYCTHTHTTHSHTVFFLKFLSLSNFGSVSFCCCCYCFGCEFFQFEREKKWKPHWIQLFSFCRLDNLSVLCVIRLLCSSLVIRDKVNICQIFCEWIFFSLSSI